MNNMEKKAINHPTLTVYFDGLCRVCDAEISVYKKSAGAEKIRFMDITAKDFDAGREGVDPFAVHKVMHAKRADGSLATRVEAFIEIWKVLPKYQWLAKVASASALRPLLNVGYEGFARIRPWLPKKQRAQDCSESPYCEVKNATTPKL
jgi:predicted DCC family thiol-disulfide oxidoreductase YuxK